MEETIELVRGRWAGLIVGAFEARPPEFPLDPKLPPPVRLTLELEDVVRLPLDSPIPRPSSSPLLVSDRSVFRELAEILRFRLRIKVTSKSSDKRP